jgi:hypothetical protein
MPALQLPRLLLVRRKPEAPAAAAAVLLALLWRVRWL